MENLIFDVLVEIPSGSRNKYEYDFDLKKIRFDRVLHSDMRYPANYGFIPETLALDGDPLDVLIFSHEPISPAVVVAVKPIGVLKMSDEKGSDAKLLCVPLADPFWKDKNTLSEINPHKLKEIEHFFRVYKDLEKKEVKIEGWANLEEAQKLYHECLENYQKSHKEKGNFKI